MYRGSGVSREWPREFAAYTAPTIAGLFIQQIFLPEHHAGSTKVIAIGFLGEAMSFVFIHQIPDIAAIAADGFDDLFG